MFSNLDMIDPRKMDNAQRAYLAEYSLEILKRDFSRSLISRIKDKQEDIIINTLACVFGARDANQLYESLVTKRKRRID